MKVFIYIILALISAGHSYATEEFSVEDTEKGCRSGNMEQCGNLSKLELESGNLINAKDHAKKGCDGGSMQGCIVLGVIFMKTDKSEAIRLFKQACDAKNTKGCINLALMKYDSGDKNEAKDLLKKACESGNAFACARQGVLENAMGNKKEAFELYKKACDGGEMLGCSDRGSAEFSNGNKDEAERLWDQACKGGEKRACEKLNAFLDEKIHLYQFACNKGDMSGCYNSGLALEKKADDNEAKGHILEVFQKACTGGEKRACDEIKTFLTSDCIKRRLKADIGCYVDGPTEKISAGSSFIRRVRIQSESCDAKAKQVEKGMGCSKVGDFEAKSGNYAEAEKIFAEGCTKTNNEGCGGIVCVGYLKMNQKKEAEAKQLFKIACSFAETTPGSYDSNAYEGCTVFPDSPNKKFNQKPLNDLTERESTCKRNWSQAWGPVNSN